MGLWVRAKLVNPLTQQEVDARALVDAGAAFTVLPRQIAERLGLKALGRKSVKTARGHAELDESLAAVEIQGKRGATPVLISQELDEVLIGVITLEALGLAVDPATNKLVETHILLL